MTDRLKGVLVTFDREIRDDDAESILTALKMIKGVLSVDPYVAEAEDYMMYERGHYDARKKMMDFLMKRPERPEKE
jgi:hypothetical protein